MGCCVPGRRFLFVCCQVWGSCWNISQDRWGVTMMLQGMVARRWSFRRKSLNTFASSGRRGTARSAIPGSLRGRHLKLVEMLLYHRPMRLKKQGKLKADSLLKQQRHAIVVMAQKPQHQQHPKKKQKEQKLCRGRKKIKRMKRPMKLTMGTEDSLRGGETL